MKGFLLVAHGSRLQSSNDEIIALGQKLSAGNDQFGWLDIAFLELTDPGVSLQIDTAVNAGITELLIFPYFLAAGYHVQTDLPDLVDQARKRHPALQLTLMQHLGARDELVSLILQLC